jgi:Mn2+/Fe2+ NRAMP family transporter
VLSQVVLSLGVPFALVPLLVLTSRRTVMGAADRNGPALIVVAGSATPAICLLHLEPSHPAFESTITVELLSRNRRRILLRTAAW